MYDKIDKSDITLSTGLTDKSFPIAEKVVPFIPSSLSDFIFPFLDSSLFSRKIREWINFGWDGMMEG